MRNSSGGEPLERPGKGGVVVISEHSGPRDSLGFSGRECHFPVKSCCIWRCYVVGCNHISKVHYQICSLGLTKLTIIFLPKNKQIWENKHKQPGFSLWRTVEMTTVELASWIGPQSLHASSPKCRSAKTAILNDAEPGRIRRTLAAAARRKRAQINKDKVMNLGIILFSSAWRCVLCA